MDRATTEQILSHAQSRSSHRGSGPSGTDERAVDQRAAGRSLVDEFGEPIRSVLQAVGTIDPNRPWVSSSGPAVKNSVCEDPAAASLPNCSDHRPSIDRGAPADSSWPRNTNFPFGIGANALIRPSPKLPTRRSPPNAPKLSGAIARPHGAFRWRFEATRSMNSPVVENSSTNPSPAPATSSWASASCFAYVTNTASPIVWIPNGANPAGSFGSSNAPSGVTSWKVSSNISTSALWKSAPYRIVPASVEAIARPL